MSSLVRRQYDKDSKGFSFSEWMPDEAQSELEPNQSNTSTYTDERVIHTVFKRYKLSLFDFGHLC